VLPVPGDVRGLAAGTQFQRDALAAGEAVIIAGARGTAIGIVPEFIYEEPESGEASATDMDVAGWADPAADVAAWAAPVTNAAGCPAPVVCGMSWTVYSLPGVPVSEHLDLGDAEYTLRSAVRSAADTLGAIRGGSGGIDVADPRGLVEQVLESERRHRAPDAAPSRALRVLENAAHVDAIITVSSGLMPIGTQTSSEAQIASEALRPLNAVVRSARIAAVGAILHEAWRQ
jgi:hypothetical protein